jgi:hypothetical protein
VGHPGWFRDCDPDEGHAIRQPKHQVDVLQRTLAWFSKHDANALLKIVMLGDSITKRIRSGVTVAKRAAPVAHTSGRPMGNQRKAYSYRNASMGSS